ncbi:hypothetical protein KJ596_04485 [Patescibacteria group bacterium]|nr:hypothetical protein [Patescibacteria group bacterium]MBU1868031.1 hypothetical protein [Patescibacteria group bacterium]
MKNRLYFWGSACVVCIGCAVLILIVAWQADQSFTRAFWLACGVAVILAFLAVIAYSKFWRIFGHFAGPVVAAIVQQAVQVAVFAWLFLGMWEIFVHLKRYQVLEFGIVIILGSVMMGAVCGFAFGAGCFLRNVKFHDICQSIHLKQMDGLVIRLSVKNAVELPEIQYSLRRQGHQVGRYGPFMAIVGDPGAIRGQLGGWSRWTEVWPALLLPRAPLPRG